MSLRGRTIVVPEGRVLDLFAGMLENHGATTVRCPLVAIEDVPEAGPVEAWLRRLISGRHDDLVFFTGEGVTRLLGFARRAGLEGQAIEGMRRARKTVRGPKPTHALRSIGLAPDVKADSPTSEGVMAALAALDMKGRQVGVQLYPGFPDGFLQFLAQAGAGPDPILCYRYASNAEDERVAEVIRAMAAGAVDLVAFTSSPQVRRFQEVARKLNMEVRLDEAMERTSAGAIGPVTASAAEQAGWRVSIALDSRFHLKPFVAQIAAGLGAAAAE